MLKSSCSEDVVYAYVAVAIEVVDAGIFRIPELFAEMLGHSSRTSLVQIQKHNKAVEEAGSVKHANVWKVNMKT